MTSKPDALSTLADHWIDHTKTTLADAIAQWSSSGNPVLIGTIEHTGRPREPQVHWDAYWKHTGYQQFLLGISVYTGVYIPGTLDCHWITTGSG